MLLGSLEASSAAPEAQSLTAWSWLLCLLSLGPPLPVSLSSSVLVFVSSLGSMLFLVYIFLPAINEPFYVVVNDCFDEFHITVLYSIFRAE